MARTLRFYVYRILKFLSRPEKYQILAPLSRGQFCQYTNWNNGRGMNFEGEKWAVVTIKNWLDFNGRNYCGFLTIRWCLQGPRSQHDRVVFQTLLSDWWRINFDRFSCYIPVVVSSEFQSLLILPWASRCILHDSADSFWVWEFWTLQKSSHLALESKKG